ncbi:MAG TPA: hypothetical protein VKY92_15045 [Verrucomicrobiae bacterium]|nr:hypothetical protein [Verrucomicrobiae bacterium]
MTPPRILFCNCTYANVVPAEVKAAVLRKICDAGVAFDAVADLCELSARKDASLKSIAEGGPVKIAACYPRAVKWLFASAGAPLDKEHTEVLNMRVQSAEEVVENVLKEEIRPNLPEGKAMASEALPSGTAPVQETTATQ